MQIMLLSALYTIGNGFSAMDVHIVQEMILDNDWGVLRSDGTAPSSIDDWAATNDRGQSDQPSRARRTGLLRDKDNVVGCINLDNFQR